MEYDNIPVQSMMSRQAGRRTGCPRCGQAMLSYKHDKCQVCHYLFSEMYEKNERWPPSYNLRD